MSLEEMRARRARSDRKCDCGCGEYTFIAVKTNSRTGLVLGQPCPYLPGHKGASLLAVTRGRSKPGSWPEPSDPAAVDAALSYRGYRRTVPARGLPVSVLSPSGQR